MISKKVEDALNEQINAEFWSGYLYLSMSCHFEAQGLNGVANWYRIQFQEEQAHALALLDYVHARGGVVALASIADVPNSWASVKEAFLATLDHERKVTGMINALYALAEEERDYATRQKLNAFVAEQVEEEENVTHILDSLNLIGEDRSGLYQLDLQLAQRTYSAPTL
ncbi:MAG: ferritin [Prevotella sp.]|nr:ferritin [Bacteroides sp.]MCM1366554.1 ferritin [Prevotella sp.]MCM1436864.1 ferritin [Prevotella sp.]